MRAEHLKAIERIRAAVGEEKLPRGVRDLLEGSLRAEEFQADADAMREDLDELHAQVAEAEARIEGVEMRASSLEAVGDAVAEALDRVEEWEDAPDREAKRQAREALVDALGSLVDAFEFSHPGDGEEETDPAFDATEAEAERQAHAAVAALIDADFETLRRRLSPGALLVVEGLRTEHWFHAEVPGDNE